MDDIREVGEEYGATTGRPRQTNWLDLDLLKRQLMLTVSTNWLSIKLMCLKKLSFWKLYEGINALEFAEGNHMQNYIKEYISSIDNSIEVLFSGNKDAI